MASYSYRAIGKDGKIKKGSMEAASSDKVISSLKSGGFIPVSVTEQGILTKDINLSFGNPVKPRDLSVFCKQFLSLLTAGVNILDSLYMLGDQTENKVLQKSIKEVHLAVQKGETLASAMKLQGKVFPNMLINMVEAGEASGSLEIAFQRMSVHFEKDAKLKGMVKKAMIYPVIVLLILAVVVVAMMVFVIPKFMKMFEDMGMDLPFMTRFVVSASNYLIAKWYVVLAVIGAVAVALNMFLSTELGKHTWGQLGLSVPLFGKLTVKTSCARLGRTLSTLLAAGIPLIDALELTGKTIDNIIVREAVLKAREAVSKGIPLSTPLLESGIFPPLVVHMIKIGEETGNIEDMLEKLADYYDEEVELATQALSAAMEPMTIVVLALVAGVLVMAIMQPILSLYGGLDSL